MPTATPRLMGAEVKRKEDPRLLTGTSSYVDDITIPGLHYVAFVRSPHAHAKVGTIDTTAAAKRAGVFKIVTGQDIRAHCQPIPLGGPSAEGGRTMWATHQAAHMLRNDIAACLGVEQNLVRVIAPEVGGGFGVKFGIYPEDVTLAVIAKLFRVPVRWTETRVEHMTSTTHGRAQVTDLEAAVEADGTITAFRMHVIADIGAYPIFTFIPDLTLFMGVGVYKVTNVDLT